MMQARLDTRLDRTLVALADPTRRAILERLSQGEARVTELAAPFSISLNSVSKHIRMLERAELVRRRVAGKEHLLSFNRAPLEEAALWIESQRALWTRRLQALDDLLRAEDRALANDRHSNQKRRAQRPTKGGLR
jgi:DNA-binding transcriptional ArsR family regulator